MKKRESIIIIIIILLLVLLYWLLCNGVFDRLVKYNSPADFAMKSTKLSYSSEIIAKNDEYAVCLSISSDNKKADIINILVKTNDSKWKLLKNKTDYSQEVYYKEKPNDFNYIYVIFIKETKQAIIIVQEYFDDTNDKTLYKVSDSINTEFLSNISKNAIKPFNISFVGFPKNIDINNYELYINNIGLPYNQWIKLLEYLKL
ncbi:MAG: hypothetical protein AAGU14_08035 [Eubacteriaceae bacterium]